MSLSDDHLQQFVDVCVYNETDTCIEIVKADGSKQVLVKGGANPVVEGTEPFGVVGLDHRHFLHCRLLRLVEGLCLRIYVGEAP